MIRRLLAILGLAVAFSVAGATGAAAYNGPGSDCFAPPDPASPTGGVSAWIDPGPAHPATGDPFSTKPGHPSIYDVYGYAGTSIVAYDPPTIGVTCITGNGTGWLISGMMGVSSVTVAVAVRLYRTVLSPTFGGIFDPIQHAAQNILGNALFLPLVGVTVVAAGGWFLWRASRASVAHTAGGAARTVGIVAVGVGCVLYPLTIGQAVDRALGEVVSSVSSLAVGTAPGHEPADQLAGAVHASVLYQTWAQATFGPGPSGEKAAREFGPRLFEAAAFTRAEDAAVTADPAKATALSDAKKADYKTVAAEVAVKYPQSYQYLRGARTDTSFGFAFVGMLGAFIAVGFLVFALFRLAYSMILVRIAVGAAPAVALVAAFPTQQHRASALLLTLGKAVTTAVVMGAGAIVFTVAGVGGIMSPTTNLPPVVKLIAMVLLTYALYRGGKEFGVISERTKAKQEERVRWGERRPEGPEPEPAPVVAPESKLRTYPRARPVVTAALTSVAVPGGAPVAARKAVGAVAVSGSRRLGAAPARAGVYHPDRAPARAAAPVRARAGVYTIHTIGAGR